MEIVKASVEEVFSIREDEYQDFKEKEETLSDWQLEKLKRDRKNAVSTIRSYQKWAEINNIDLSKNGNAREKFITETMYILINRILLIRIAEDKNIIPRRISNGGIKDFKQFIRETRINYNKLLYIAFDTMREVYEHFFKEDIFDWYNPDSELLLWVLFVFNRYNFARVNREILGNLYQKYIDREERKRLGQFYTPEKVVDYILDGVGYKSNQEIEGKTLLDPACGSGGFLVPAVNRLVERLRSKNFDAITILDKVRDNIYGFDINPFAAHLAETNLLFQVMDLISEAKKLDPVFKMDQFNVFVTDSLKVPEEDQKKKQLSFVENDLAFSTAFMDAEVVKDIKLKRGRFAGGVDFVVGNPPYVRPHKISHKEKEYLWKNYNTYVAKSDIHSCFIEFGIKHIKFGGFLGFITSDTWRVLDSARELRKYVLTNTVIKKLSRMPKSVFEDAEVQALIFVLQKQDHGFEENEISIVDFDSKNLINIVRQEVFIKDRKNIINIVPSHVSDLLNNITKDSIPLEKLGNIDFGLKTGDDKNFIKKTKDDEWDKKIVSSRDIKRYNLEWNGEYVRYLPKEMKENKKTARPGEKERFECQKLIISRMADRLSGVYDENNYYVKDALLLNNFSKDIEAKYLLAILNSSVLSFYYGNIFTTIDVHRNELLGLPIKITSLEAQQQFATLADQIFQTNQSLHGIEKLIDNIPTLTEKFQSEHTEYSKTPIVPLSDIPGLTHIQLEKHLGKPKILREEKRVYLARKSYIDLVNEDLAEYIELYLKSIQETLRGFTKPDILRVVKVPQDEKMVESLLSYNRELKVRKEKLNQKRDEIDREIDQKVYGLYGLSEEEVRTVEKSF